MRGLKTAAFSMILVCLAMIGCKKEVEVAETAEVVTLQLSLETGFVKKDDIKKVVVVLDAKDPKAQVVFGASDPKSGTIGGVPIRWEYTDYDNDQALEQVITIQGNPFDAHTFYLIHVLPKVTLAIPMKVSVIALDAQGNELGWGFGCDNQGQEIYLGVRQIVGVAVKALRNDPCPPCRHRGCDAFGNCPFDFNCRGECCECKEPCGAPADGGTCTGDKTCVDECCISGGLSIGETCTGPSECGSGFCKDGKCCDTACTTPCYSCQTGWCTKLTDGEDDPECKGASTCNAIGQCKRGLGEVCTGGVECASGICKDGKCCNTECNALCHTCATGTCVPMISGEDVPECSGASTCDAAGKCNAKPGQSCAVAGDCASGHCKDGVCCDAPCTEPCKRCHTGTCQPVNSGVDEPECGGTSTCSATGQCLKANGESCTGAVECASGHCKDGKCCDTECTTPCHSCATGTCGAVVNADDEPDCTGARTCDALSVCKKKNGEACTGKGECASGICKDGKCCNTECTALCHSCQTGTCAAVTNGDDVPECSSASTCDGSGVCKPKPGQSCISAGDCASGFCKDGVCCNEACGAPCKSCLTGTCQAVLNAGDTPECAGFNRCDGSGACLLKDGQTCTGASQCASGFCADGKCCNGPCTAACQSCLSGACTAVRGTPDDPQCTGDNTCDDSGNCRKKNGQACTGGGDCASGHCKDGKCCNNECTTPCHSCETGACTAVAGADDLPECTSASTCDASGTCKPKPGQGCAAGTDCASGFCKDGVCCATACDQPCQSCLTGFCQAVKSAEDAPECAGASTCGSTGQCQKAVGQTCTGPEQCASGFCKDGKCCDTACTTACYSCATGVCTMIKNGVDADSCTGDNSCDASGVCRLKQGAACTGGGECASGHCVDGKCCNTECSALCFSCQTGTCTLVAGKDDYPDCTGASTCDGNGVCKPKPGQACNAGADCASGHCKDGVCCDSACEGQCKSCVTGICNTIASRDDDPECKGENTCSASGACLKRKGESCTGSSQCASGYCKDSKCCDTECTAPCHSCATGACTAVKSGVDADSCTGSSTCDAEGHCKKKNGETCTGGVQCASGFCKDSKCCDTECSSPCYDCDSGTCSQVTSAEDSPECAGDNTCNGSGVCKKKNGQECTEATQCASGNCRDGRCCNTACGASCQSCLTGKCEDVKSADDADSCTGENTCSASGVCLKRNGETCTGGGQCASGHCKDNKCCDTECIAPCYNCGSGTCLPVKGGDDVTECQGNYTCDSGGSCKRKDGQGCTGGVVCASGFCKDGACCNTQCDTPCHTCTTGSCVQVKSAEDYPECAGDNICNASGICQLKIGQTCANGTDCVLGHCVDGVCCNESCTDTCKSCITGTCSAVKGAEDPGACDGTQSCDASGACKKKNGQDCNGGSECASAICKDGKCCDNECVTPCRSCVTGTCLPITNGPDNSECMTTKSCDAQGSCKLIQGQTCAGKEECLSGFCAPGGKCCDRECPALCHSCATGTCLQLTAGSEDNPDCMGTKACSAEGECKKKNAQPCTGGVECASGICKDGVCCDTECVTPCHSCAADGHLGSCWPTSGEDYPECTGLYTCSATSKCLLSDGQLCQGSSQCASGNCVDGRCCNNECTTTCYTCMTGTCSPVALNQDDTGCSGGSTCDGEGHCLKESGQTCSSGTDCLTGHCVGGKCCDLECAADCYSCSTGACLPVALNTDDPPCSGANTCDGAGSCLRKLAQSCDKSEDCASNFCVDTRCCDTACEAVCRACNVGGKEGTCSKVAAGVTDPPDCTGSYTCSPLGACLLKNGNTCSSTAQCASEFCKDGLCCDTACVSPCHACNSTGKEGVCTAVAAGSEDHPECIGNYTCSGSAKCLLKKGQDCLNDSSCASGYCADGKCCDTACADSCYRCATGTCTLVTNGQDFPQCAGDYNICDENGGCSMKVLDVAAGLGFTCAVMENHRVKCWGRNDHGQLGNGTTMFSPRPVSVQGITNAVALTAGLAHVCVLLSDGFLKCWGRNDYGQLGDNKNSGEKSLTPVLVDFINPPIQSALAVAAGDYHTCAIIGSGFMWCWGYNNNGQLGTGNNNTYHQPTSVSGISNAVDVAAGGAHTCARLNDNSLRCWGDNFYGQLGDRSTTDSNVPVTVPSPIVNVTTISLGKHHTCATQNDGRAYCWGYNAYGQIGNGNNSGPQLCPKPNGSIPCSTIPEMVQGISTAQYMTTGDEHSCAVLADGTMKCWGRNHHGQLGQGSLSDSAVPATVSGVTTTVKARGGAYHTCSLHTGGNLKCWGDNEYGQLGDGNAGRKPFAVEVYGLHAASTVTAGGQHSCAGMESGVARCWGENGSGQLGDGTKENSPTPVSVSGLPLISGISAFFDHTCAVTNTGGIKCWGDNSQGQLGNNSTTDSTLPVDVSGISSAQDLADGFSLSHTCALLQSGQVACWGRNNEGQLGNGTNQSSLVPVMVSNISDGKAVSTGGSYESVFSCAIAGNGLIQCWGAATIYGNIPKTISSYPAATQISGGGNHACARMANKTIKCWGHNGFGQLGDGTKKENYLTPVSVMGINTALAVAAGSAHSCALLENGTIMCWGSNLHGQLGTDIAHESLSPVLVSGITTATALSAGMSHTCARLSGGRIKCWGSNLVFQTGDGTGGRRLIPGPVVGIPTPMAVTAGNGHNCALLKDGRVKCWGGNSSGQVGDGTTTDKGEAVNSQGVSTAVAVAAGATHTCVLLDVHSVNCWGENGRGQLGNGTSIDSLIPATVSGLNDAYALASGRNHSCIINKDRELRCWGAGDQGQLGNGHNGDVLVPVTPHALSTAQQIALGGDHSCALLTDGTAKCWGDNAFGQVGDGTTTDRNTPVKVSGITSAVALATGEAHTCALLGNYMVKCWGRNDHGQLGDGSIFSRMSPVFVMGLSNVVALTAGEAHTCALLKDGSARCWGKNDQGQLGDGTTSARLFPVTVSGLTTALAIAAGDAHTCALKGDATVQCWGKNASKQLGDGSTVSSAIPVTVQGF